MSRQSGLIMQLGNTELDTLHDCSSNGLFCVKALHRVHQDHCQRVDHHYDVPAMDGKHAQMGLRKLKLTVVIHDILDSIVIAKFLVRCKIR